MSDFKAKNLRSLLIIFSEKSLSITTLSNAKLDNDASCPYAEPNPFKTVVTPIDFKSDQIFANHLGLSPRQSGENSKRNKDGLIFRASQKF